MDSRYTSYQIAVEAINEVSGNEAQTARRDLEALRALIALLLDKLPPEGVDYETEIQKCIHCDPAITPIGPDDWCYCLCHKQELGP